MKSKEKVIAEIISGVGGRIVHVVFTKRLTGEKRIMKCRLGVKKYLSGKGPKYNAAKKKLLSVYDMEAALKNPAKAYRNIDLTTVSEVVCGEKILYKEMV